MLPSTGGLDHQFQAFHAQDGYAVASCEEHWKRERHCFTFPAEHKTWVSSHCQKKSSSDVVYGRIHLQRNCFFFSKGRLWNTSQKSLMVGWSVQYSPLYSVLWRAETKIMYYLNLLGWLWQNELLRWHIFLHRYLKRDLFELHPVIVGVANDHGLQFVWLEQV